MPFPRSIKAAAIMRPQRWTTDLIGVWALSLGTIAVSLAALIYYADQIRSLHHSYSLPLPQS